MKIYKVRKTDHILKGTVELPYSKSISNRLLMIRAFSGMELRIDNLSKAADTLLLEELLEKVARHRNIESDPKPVELNAGNAGTVLRFLLPYLCTIPGTWLLTGSERMKERPVGILVEALRVGGAVIDYMENEGYPPLIVRVGSRQSAVGSQQRDTIPALQGMGSLIGNGQSAVSSRQSGYFTGGDLGKIRADVSSQFLSALLMAGAFVEKGVQFEIDGEMSSEPYVEMTIKILMQLGIEVSRQPAVGSRQSTVGSRQLAAGNDESDIPDKQQNTAYCLLPTADSLRFPEVIEVERDWSAASYWYEMAAFSGEADIFIPGLKQESLQGDSILPKLFSTLGVSTSFEEGGIRLQKSRPGCGKFSFNFRNHPDLVPAIAVTCAGMNMQAHLSGLKSLSIKETDRLRAISNELTDLGFKVVASNDEMLIIPVCCKRGTSKPVKTYEDHRMAMAFAPLAIILNEILIENPDVTRKSYPEFWEDLKKMRFNIEEW